MHMSPSLSLCGRAAITCVGALYEQLGRLLISSFKDSVGTLLKAMKSAEVWLHFSVLSSVHCCALSERVKENVNIKKKC